MGDGGLADLGPALRLRQRRSARRRNRRLVMAAVIIVIVAGLAFLVLFSDVLSVRTIRVRGAVLLTQDEVVAAAQVPPSQPMARLDTAAIAERVAALPEVATVSVHRSWPNTVTVDVTEHQAVFQRDVSAGGTASYQWVDAQGVVFHTDATRLGVPLLTSPTDDPALLEEVAEVLAGVPADLLAQTQSVSATSVDQVKLFLSDGRQIVWGSADESALKAQVIEVLLKQPGTVYDVSAPGHPAVR
jgi:cell division protein FtsQ